MTIACFGGVVSEEALLALAALLCSVLLVLLLLRHRRRAASNICALPGETPGLADQYKLIAKASGEVFFNYDIPSGQFRWTADIGASFLGYKPGEQDLQHDRLIHLSHRLDRPLLEKALPQLRQNARLDLEVRLQKADGGWCWIHLIAIPVTDPDGTARIVGVARNTQELHETQEALAEARRLETVGTLAGGIAHEFNNHLTPVRGYIEMALDQIGSGHPAADGLKTALDRVEYCSELVSQIQAYGRRSLLLPKPVEITHILPSMIRVGMAMHRERAPRIILTEQWPPTLPTIWMDQAQFQQAIIHLIRNAVQAMPNGGTLTIQARELHLQPSDCANRRDARPGHFVCVSVTDTGTGIAAEDLERVLDPFYTTHNRGEARGMGLKMVQGMAAQHGGWLEIKSEPGKGTAIYLYFPVRKLETAHGVVAKSSPDGTMRVLPAAPIGRMLVADDELFIRDIVRRSFENEGWVVDQAADNDEVLSLVGTHTYELMVIDVTMPGPTIEDTLGKLAKICPQTRILLISGFARDSRIDQLLELAAAEFMGKPFSPREIIARVDRMMGET